MAVLKFIMKLSLVLLPLSISYARNLHFIKDPQGLMKSLDEFIGWTTFEETFKCGTKFTYQMNQCARRCEPYYCEEICKDPSTSVVTIENCTKESAEFISDGKVWIKVLKNRYKDFNTVRGWLGAPLTGRTGKQREGENIGKNYVTLKSIEKEKFKLQDGIVIEVRRLHVIYSFWDEEVQNFNHSHQSMVVGHANETGGLFLEHRFHELKKPVSQLLKFEIPGNQK